MSAMVSLRRDSALRDYPVLVINLGRTVMSKGKALYPGREEEAGDVMWKARARFVSAEGAVLRQLAHNSGLAGRLPPTLGGSCSSDGCRWSVYLELYVWASLPQSAKCYTISLAMSVRWLRGGSATVPGLNMHRNCRLGPYCKTCCAGACDIEKHHNGWHI